MLWSGEIYGIKSTHRIWTRRNTECNPKNNITTVSHSGGNLMLCGYFPVRKRDVFTALRGPKDWAMYHKILGKDLLPSTRKMKTMTQNKVMKWPSQSPDRK